MCKKSGWSPYGETTSLPEDVVRMEGNALAVKNASIGPRTGDASMSKILRRSSAFTRKGNTNAPAIGISPRFCELKPARRTSWNSSAV